MRGFSSTDIFRGIEMISVSVENSFFFKGLIIVGGNFSKKNSLGIKVCSIRIVSLTFYSKTHTSSVILKFGFDVNLILGGTPHVYFGSRVTCTKYP